MRCKIHNKVSFWRMLCFFDQLLVSSNLSYHKIHQFLEKIQQFFFHCSVTNIWISYSFLVVFQFFPLKLSITSRENTGSLTHVIYWSTNSIKSLRFGSHSLFLQILYALFCIVQLGNQHTYNRWVDIIRNMFSYYSFTFEKDVVEQAESFCITKF